MQQTMHDHSIIVDDLIGSSSSSSNSKNTRQRRVVENAAVAQMKFIYKLVKHISFKKPIQLFITLVVFVHRFTMGFTKGCRETPKCRCRLSIMMLKMSSFCELRLLSFLFFYLINFFFIVSCVFLLDSFWSSSRF